MTDVPKGTDEIPILVGANPDVYIIEDMAMEERFKIYSEEILQGVSCSKVAEAMVAYIVETVEPVGWTGIWRSTIRSSGLKADFDFVVDVLDVSQLKLEADVTLLKIVPSVCIKQYADDIKAFFQSQSNRTVPLEELYPIFVESGAGNWAPTAVALDNVRFFYEHLWRPWDDDDDDDAEFVTKHLGKRLKLHYDIETGRFPLHTAVEIKGILTKARDIHHEIQNLQDDLDHTTHDQFLKEDDLMRCFDLTRELEELQKELQLLENPALSALVSKRRMVARKTERRSSEDPACHVVAKRLTVKMMKEYLANVSEDSLLECHDSLYSALAACSDGDMILMCPGHYMCSSGWFADSITIRGMGKSAKDTVIAAIDDGSDMFFNSSADRLRLENLKLVPTLAMQCTLMVHEGCTQLDNCDVMACDVGVSALRNAKVAITNCSIFSSAVAGILMRCGSAARVERCRIYDCEQAAIVLQLTNDGGDAPFETKAAIRENEFDNNLNDILYSSTEALQDRNATFIVGADDLFKHYDGIVVTGNKFTRTRGSSTGRLTPDGIFSPRDDAGDASGGTVFDYTLESSLKDMTIKDQLLLGNNVEDS